MDNWLANIVGDVDSLHIEIVNLNDPLVGFCFIRSIDLVDEPPSFILDRLINNVTVLWLEHQVSNALFFLPLYLRGLEGF
jgi:hypothetical protein